MPSQSLSSPSSSGREEVSIPFFLLTRLESHVFVQSGHVHLDRFTPPGTFQPCTAWLEFHPTFHSGHVRLAGWNFTPLYIPTMASWLEFHTTLHFGHGRLAEFHTTLHSDHGRPAEFHTTLHSGHGQMAGISHHFTFWLWPAG